MKSHFLCFSLVLTVSLAARIEYSVLSSEENNQLQETCGRDVHYHTKVLNGETADKFPSAASVNIKGVLTASIISPRHVLLFNIFEFDKETMRLSLFNDTELIEKGDCDINDWILPEEVNEWFVVKFANGKGDEKQENKVRRIAVLGGCIAIDTYKPMILELENNMEFDEGHGPVCIPSIEDVEEFKGEEEFTVYGLGPKGDKLTSAQFIEKECEKSHDWNYVFCGKALNESKGLCSVRDIKTFPYQLIIIRVTLEVAPSFDPGICAVSFWVFMPKETPVVRPLHKSTKNRNSLTFATTPTQFAVKQESVRMLWKNSQKDRMLTEERLTK
uniref:Uncharacterized protein n=1 Tax=Caenorhabditis tropicalis TaxID=1561998 RepID=A0A1I7T632_9PELO